MIQFGPAALKCHIKLRPSPEKWSVLAQSLLSLSAELFCVLVLSCRSDGDPRCMNTHAHTHQEDYHMGSRALGGETRRVLTLLFLWFFSSLHQERQQKKERDGEGGWR